MIVSYKCNNIYYQYIILATTLNILFLNYSSNIYLSLLIYSFNELNSNLSSSITINEESG